MPTAPAGGYGEHMPGWDVQHPLMRHSISCPRAPAQLCWLLQEVAEPRLVPSLPWQTGQQCCCCQRAHGPEPEQGWPRVPTAASPCAAAQPRSAQDQAGLGLGTLV